jgi:hypothetical protein
VNVASRIERRLVRSGSRDKQRPFMRRRLLHLYTGLNKKARPRPAGAKAVVFQGIGRADRPGVRGRGYNPPHPRIGVHTSMFGKKIKAGYESDATRLIRDLLREKPQLHDEQARGRSLWWDRKLDPDQLRRAQESRVPQKGYVYQNAGD